MKAVVSFRKGLPLFMLLVLMLGSIYLPNGVPSAHAASPGPVGTVCIAQPADPTAACTQPSGSTVPPVFNGPLTGPHNRTQIRFTVFINGSQAMNGFLIELHANHTQLLPVGFDPTGSVLSGSTQTVCFNIQGVTKTGVCPTLNATDILNTMTVGILESGTSTIYPTTGILFTAIYNVTGTTATGVPISVGFERDNTNCVNPPQSTGSSNFCVDITNNGTVDPEKVQAASFANDATDEPTPLPYLLLSTPSTTVTANSGQTIMATITASSVNSYPNTFATCPANTIALSAQTSSTSLSAVPVPTTIGPTYPATASLSITAPSGAGSAGNYSITLYGQYCTTDPNGALFNDTLVSTLNLIVKVQDYGLAVSPNPATFSLATTGSATVTLTSLNKFSTSGTSTVSFSSNSTNQQYTLSAGSGASSCTPGTITTTGSCTVSLTPAGMAQITLGLSEASSTVHQYRVSVSASLTANGVADTHNALLIINWSLLVSTSTSVTCSPNPVVQLAKTTCTATVTDTSSSPTTPTGIVNFSNNATSTSGSIGTFTPSSGVCSLVASTVVGTASCSVTYSPSKSVHQLIFGNYTGDSRHFKSGQAIALTALDVTSTTISCSPSPVNVNSASNCSALVTDNSPKGTPPTGMVTFAVSGGTGSFSAMSCTLTVQSTSPPTSGCSVVYTPTTVGRTAQHSIIGNYTGDSSHGISRNTGPLAITGYDTTSTTVTCSPGTVNTGSSTACTATVTDTNATVSTPTGTVTFTVLFGTGTFSSVSCTLVAGTTGVASCGVTYTPQTVGSGTHQVTGAYSSDDKHIGSSGSSGVTVPGHSTSTSITCAPSIVTVGSTATCAITVTDTSTTPTTPTGILNFTAAPSSQGIFNATSCVLAAGATSSVAGCGVKYTPLETSSTSHIITATYSSDSTHISTMAQFSIGVAGLVCIAQPADLQAGCGATPPVFNMKPTTPSTQIEVAVYVNDSRPMNSFVVSLKADHNYLVPVGIVPPSQTVFVFTGLLNFVALECIQGRPAVGSSCPASDSADTLTVAIEVTGSSTTSNPTSGLLFMAIYNITGTTGSGGISIGFQQDSANCTNESSGSSNYCVSMTNSGSIVPELVRPATFNNNGTPPPYVTLSATNTVVAIPGAINNVTITGSTSNGFPATLSICNGMGPPSGQVSMSAVASSPTLKPLFSASLLNFSSTVTAQVTKLSIPIPNKPSANKYSITVLGTYCTYDATNTMNDTLITTLSLNVIIPDFTVSSSPSSLAAKAPGVQVSSIISVASINTFAGTVTLTPTISPSTGLSASLNSSTVMLMSGGTGGVNATFTASAAGSYTVTVSVTGPGFTHKVIITITVSNVQVAVEAVAFSPTSLNVGQDVTFTITVQNLGTVPVTTTVYALVGNVTVAQQNVTLAPNSNQTVTLVWNTAGYSPGTYALGAKVLAAPSQTNFANITKTSPVSLMLSAPPSSPFTPLVIAIIAVITAVLIIATLLILRRRRRSEGTL